MACAFWLHWSDAVPRDAVLRVDFLELVSQNHATAPVPDHAELGDPLGEARGAQSRDYAISAHDGQRPGRLREDSLLMRAGRLAPGGPRRLLRFLPAVKSRARGSRDGSGEGDGNEEGIISQLESVSTARQDGPHRLQRVDWFAGSL